MPQRFFSAFFVLIFAQVAHAGIYVEPFVGYTQGTTDTQTTVANGGVSAKLSSTAIPYGAEFGWIFGSGFRLGANLELANVDLKNDSTGATTKNSYMGTMLMFGYKFPQDIIGYAGVGSATTTDDATPKTTTTGTVLKLGAHKKLINHVSAGAEYVLYTWSESTTEGSPAIKIMDFYEKYNSSAIQAVIRIPFGSEK